MYGFRGRGIGQKQRETNGCIIFFRIIFKKFLVSRLDLTALYNNEVVNHFVTVTNINCLKQSMSFI